MYFIDLFTPKVLIFYFVSVVSALNLGQNNLVHWPGLIKCCMNNTQCLKGGLVVLVSECSEDIWLVKTGSNYYFGD